MYNTQEIVQVKRISNVDKNGEVPLVVTTGYDWRRGLEVPVKPLAKMMINTIRLSFIPLKVISWG